jgi:hypothetical protein
MTLPMTGTLRLCRVSAWSLLNIDPTDGVKYVAILNCNPEQAMKAQEESRDVTLIFL